MLGFVARDREESASRDRVGDVRGLVRGDGSVVRLPHAALDRVLDRPNAHRSDPQAALFDALERSAMRHGEPLHRARVSRFVPSGPARATDEHARRTRALELAREPLERAHRDRLVVRELREVATDRARLGVAATAPLGVASDARRPLRRHARRRPGRAVLRGARHHSVLAHLVHDERREALEVAVRTRPRARQHLVAHDLERAPCALAHEARRAADAGLRLGVLPLQRSMVAVLDEDARLLRGVDRRERPAEIARAPHGHATALDPDDPRDRCAAHRAQDLFFRRRRSASAYDLPARELTDERHARGKRARRHLRPLALDEVERREEALAADGLQHRLVDERIDDLRRVDAGIDDGRSERDRRDAHLRHRRRGRLLAPWGRPRRAARRGEDGRDHVRDPARVRHRPERNPRPRSRRELGRRRNR